MKADAFRAQILRPWLQALEPVIRIARREPSETLLLAIAIQESNLQHRYQVLSSGASGPARGWWQFELYGVAGVLTHPRTASRAETVCEHCHVEPKASAVYRAIEGHDGLAVAFARLLLWSDPAPLPEGDEQAEWDCYARNWKPGKPNRERWSRSWRRAVMLED